MAVIIVDFLEVVGVQQQQNTTVSGQRSARRTHEGAAIGQAGQSVRVCQMDQSLVQFILLRPDHLPTGHERQTDQSGNRHDFERVQRVRTKDDLLNQYRAGVQWQQKYRNIKNSTAKRCRRHEI